MFWVPAFSCPQLAHQLGEKIGKLAFVPKSRGSVVKGGGVGGGEGAGEAENHVEEEESVQCPEPGRPPGDCSSATFWVNGLRKVPPWTVVFSTTGWES